MSNAQETRRRNAEYREKLDARRNGIEIQVGEILQTVTSDPNLTADQKVRLAELAVELYHAF